MGSGVQGEGHQLVGRAIACQCSCSTWCHRRRKGLVETFIELIFFILGFYKSAEFYYFLSNMFGRRRVGCSGRARPGI